MLIACADEQEQMAFGASLGAAMQPPLLVFLRGDLGAGKTTLVRGLLRGLGWQGTVRSPTFTLVETYPLDSVQVAHLDLYRLVDPEELEFLGLRDLLGSRSLVLIEWPERGEGWLPTADLEILIQHAEHGRNIQLVAGSQAGEQVLGRMDRIKSDYKD